MLSAASPSYLHVLQSLALVFVSLTFLPLSVFLLFASYTLHPWLLFRYNLPSILRLGHFNRSSISSAAHLNGNGHLSKPIQSGDKQSAPFMEQRTILVTGVGMTKGLYIARAFHLAGYRVIGADCAPYKLIPPMGRFSRAIDQFYTLDPPLEGDSSSSDRYIHALVQIIQHENISLWISCSGVTSALEDAHAKDIIALRAPSCSCIQFDLPTTRLLHEKDTFIAHAASLGLPVPETLTVTTRAAVHKVLHESPRTKRRYVMKSVNMNDASRGEISTLLPRRTLSETYNHLARLPINESNPWVLQQYVSGNREYCTHSLVIRGKVKAFVACPSSELLMHYHALPHPDEALSRAMLRFTEEFARKCHQNRSKSGGGRGGGEGEGEFTGHLSFDFLIEEQVTERGVENVLRAIECNPRAHTAVALFRGTQGAEMVQAYLSALEPDTNSEEHQNEKGQVVMNGSHSLNRSSDLQEDEAPPAHSSPPQPPPVYPSPTTPAIYWLAHDITTLLLQPLLRLLQHPLSLLASPTALLSPLHTFLTHLLFYHDGAYETWDPLPAFVLYHVYWPGVLAGRLLQGRRWSRVNVSTGKVFGC